MYKYRCILLIKYIIYNINNKPTKIYYENNI